MIFNIYYSTKTDAFTLMKLSIANVNTVVQAYLLGEKTITVNGEKYEFDEPKVFKIFTFENDLTKDPSALLSLASRYSTNKKGEKFQLGLSDLRNMGNDVTNKYIADMAYGERKNWENTNYSYIAQSRLESLQKIKSNDFNFTRLIQLCTEVNDSFSRGNYLSTALLLRSILNHVPPIFGFNSFKEVANNYKNKSFKDTILPLETFLRNIADGYAHDIIGKKVNVPTSVQVNFSQPLDRLLSEVLSIMESKSI